MPRHRIPLLLAAALLAAACHGGGSDSSPSQGGGPPASGPSVSAHQTTPDLADPSTVPLYDVFELSLAYPDDFGTQANFRDVDVAVTFTSPTGIATAVGGFYYDTLASGDSIWKARFAPREAGVWTYDWELSVPAQSIDETGSGSFTAVAGPRPGYLRIHKTNPRRWQLDDGTPFAPLGLNVCLQRKSALELDGGDRLGAFRGDAQGRPPMDVYLATHAGAGFNLFRFSPENCSVRLVSPDLGTYYVDTAQDFDRLFRALRAHDFHVLYGVFGFLLGGRDTPPTAEELRFLTYCVNRWGAYVDVWELQNERHSTEAWIDPAAAHVRAVDPYDHPISTSWRRPAVASIDVNAPHWYTDEPALDSDLVTAERADLWRSEADKPVLVGETGNRGDAWSPDSAVRARLRSWTAFFEEVGFVYWDASWATNHTGLFLYIGPEERRQFHALQWFSERVLRSDSLPAPIQVSEASVRAYGLSSSEGVALWLHHFANHTSAVQDLKVDFDSPAAGKGTWLDPATGVVLGQVDVVAGSNQLVAPPFAVDVAFFSQASPLHTPPLALLAIENAQDDGDADNDGLTNYGPGDLPFGEAPLRLVLDASDSHDLDGGAVTFEWEYGDGSPNGTGAVVAHTYPRGLFLTRLLVTDDEGETASQGFLVRATADRHPDANDPPYLAALGLEDVTVREGEPLVIAPLATDRELVQGVYVHEEIVSYSVQGLPPGASFFGGQEDPALTWTPDFDQSGTWEIDFVATDSSGATSQTRRVTVTVLDVP